MRINGNSISTSLRHVTTRRAHGIVFCLLFFFHTLCSYRKVHTIFFYSVFFDSMFVFVFQSIFFSFIRVSFELQIKQVLCDSRITNLFISNELLFTYNYIQYFFLHSLCCYVCAAAVERQRRLCTCLLARRMLFFCKLSISLAHRSATKLKIVVINGIVMNIYPYF